MRTRLAGVALLVGRIVAPSPAGPARADGDSAPPPVCTDATGLTPAHCVSVTSMAVSRRSVAVTGAGSVAVTYRIGLLSADGIKAYRNNVSNPVTAGDPHELFPQLLLSTAHQIESLGLTLQSGTTHDGTWTGTIHVSARDAGTLSAGAVRFQNSDNPFGDVLPSEIPAAMQHPLRVAASHVPKLTVARFAAPVRYGSAFVVSGRVTDAATGTSMARITVHVQRPDIWCDCYLSHYTATTDAAGRWRVTVAHLRGTGGTRVSIVTPTNSDGNTPAITESIVEPATINVVVASLARSTARVGDSIAVTGSDGPIDAQSDEMVLEKWVHHAWLEVRTGPQATSGRFILRATPSAPGNWQYRVRDRYRGGVSPVLTLHVTA